MLLEQYLKYCKHRRIEALKEFERIYEEILAPKETFSA